MNRSAKRSPNLRSGFTLVELLVVIGIILILIGLLFPAISAVQKQARASATKQEMSRIQSACNAYYLDFRAYPGPLSESQVYPQGTYQGTPIPTTPYCPIPISVTGSYPLTLAAGASPTPSFPNGVTSTENLFLGLEGCLAYYPGPTPPAGFYYTPPASAPSGPASLNPANPGVHASYLNYSPKEITFDGASDAKTGLASNINNSNILPITAGTATDSSIPEFVDHFSPTRPILYMRARVGITCSATANTMLNHIGTKSTACQYDENQLVPYGWSATYTAGSNQKMGVSTTDFPPPAQPVSTDFAYTSDDTYFANPGVWGTPNGKDGYILISAGPDGIYGTHDDIILSD
jgi:prepilin-type N-terminal cleavage/methylation domain-containing protein